MYYEINISWFGSHFFATSKHSLGTEAKAKEVYEVLREKFPENEGYDITVARWENDCGL